MAVGPGFHVDAQGNLHIGSTRETFDSTTISEAPFSVTKSGSLNATTGTFSGNLSAAGGTFSGDLSAAGGTFSGNLSAAGGTFTGTLSGVDGTFSGTISGNQISGGTISGTTISGDTIDGGTINGTTINAGTITTGELNLSNLTVSGTMSANRISGGNISGDLISGGTITFGSSIMTSGQHILTGLITISPTTSGSVIGAQNSNVTIRGGFGTFDTLNVDGNAQIDGNASVDGYVEGDEFRGNNSTVDIHRNGTSNGIRITGSGSGAYVYGYNSSGTAQIIYSPFSGVSDERLKENIADLTLGLDEINALRPVTFDWKASDIDDIPNNRYGFIAQEVESVLPSMITTQPSTRIELSEDEDGEMIETEVTNSITLDDGTEITEWKSIDEKPLVYMLVKAVQELSAKNDELESRLAALEG